MIHSAAKLGNALGRHGIWPNKQQACFVVLRARMLVPVLVGVAADMHSMWRRVFALGAFGEPGMGYSLE